jgi:CDP-glycerol glycerophosphotransferase (TagB/SpsB family)
LAAQDRFNVIIAPHQRLVEKDPAVRDVIAQLASLPHIHTDLDSFAMVDGTYMATADIYLGDTSSQIVEFLVRPRPCVFLNPNGLDWRATDDHAFWECGDVVSDLKQLANALDRAPSRHPAFLAVQTAFARRALGKTGPEAPRRAARAIIEAIDLQGSQTLPADRIAMCEAIG